MLDTLVACRGNGDDDAFASMLVDGMLKDGRTWEQALVDLLHLAVAAAGSCSEGQPRPQPLV